MTYSCSDFADDVFEELHHVGAIHQVEHDDDDLDGDPGLQASRALVGIARLIEVKEAFEQYRRAVKDVAARKGMSLQDGVFCEADERGKKALANIESRETSPKSNAVEVLSGYFSCEGLTLRADFQVPAGASVAEKDAAFLAVLAQQAEINYVGIGASDHPLLDLAPNVEPHDDDLVSAQFSGPT